MNIKKKVNSMKTRFLMTMAVAAMTLAACNNEETDDWAGEIRLSSGLEVQQTRSIATGLQGNQIADGVHVGFFINEDVTSGATTTYTQNLDYTANGSGGFNGTTVYYPQSSNGVKIYAYAPWEAGLALNGNYAFSIKADQSKDADYLASGLLWGQPMKLKSGSNSEYEPANPVARTKDAVPVSFKHLLSKIQVELKPGDGLTANDFKGAKLEILSALPSVSLTLANGTISSASGAVTDVLAADYPTNATPTLTAAAIVVPQTFTKGTKFMQVTLATGGELFYTLPNKDSDTDLTLESGKIYKYEITVKLTGLTVTSTIEDWETIGNGDPVKGDAVMD